MLSLENSQHHCVEAHGAEMLQGAQDVPGANIEPLEVHENYQGAQRARREQGAHGAYIDAFRRVTNPFHRPSGGKTVASSDRVSQEINVRDDA